MKLKNLEISEEPSYSQNAGQYTGRVKFANDSGDITINLNAVLSSRILEVVASELVATSREVATNLTAACIDAASGIPQLESK